MRIVKLFLVGLFLFLSNLFAADWEPPFIIIGAQKAGTTALQFFLNQHPELYIKGETHFFSVYFDRGIEWYKKNSIKRSMPGKLAFDKSPTYLIHPLVPKRIHAFYPDMKIIVLLRNPVDRAYSQYWMNRGNEKESLSFEEAIAAEKSRIAGEFEKLCDEPFYYSFAYREWTYLTRGRYAEQLKRWFRYFPREQFLFLTSSELRKSPEGVVNKICDFVGLEHLTEELEPYPQDHSNYPPMNPETRAMLVEYFKPYNAELEKLLGREFNWN